MKKKVKADILPTTKKLKKKQQNCVKKKTILQKGRYPDYSRRKSTKVVKVKKRKQFSQQQLAGENLCFKNKVPEFPKKKFIKIKSATTTFVIPANL